MMFLRIIIVNPLSVTAILIVINISVVVMMILLLDASQQREP